MRLSFRKLALVGALASAVGVAQAGLNLNQVWATTTSITLGNGFAYHPASDNCLVGRGTANGDIILVNGADGASTGATLLKGGGFGGLGVFAIGTDSTGQILGYDDADGNVGTSTSIVNWTSTAAVPTSGALAGRILARNMDAADVATVSSGTKTLVVLSGGISDTTPFGVFEKLGPTSFQSVFFTGVGSAVNPTNPACKAGATISDDGQWVVGSCTVSSPYNGVHIFQNGTGGPLSTYNWVWKRDGDSGLAVADVAVDGANGVAFALRTSAATPLIDLVRLSDGAVIDSRTLAVPGVATFGTARGGIDVVKNGSAGKLFVFLRSPADSGGVATLWRFDYGLVLTAAQDWQYLQ